MSKKLQTKTVQEVDPAEEKVRARIAELQHGEEEPPKPNAEELRAKQEEQKTKIEELQQERNSLQQALRKDIEDSKKEKSPAQQKRMGLIGERGSIDQQIGELVRQVGELSKEIRGADRFKREQRQRFQSQGAGEFTSVEAVDREIKRLEAEMETSGSGSIKRERRTMNRIKQLEGSKSVVREYAHVEQIIAQREEERKTKMEELQEVSTLLAAKREEKEKVSEHIQKIADDNKPSEETEQKRKKHKDKEEDVKQKINDAYSELKRLNEEYRAQNDVHQAWRRKEQTRKQQLKDEQLELRRIINQRKQKEKEEKQRADALEHMAEERLKRLNPHEEQINVCVNLLQYFESMQRNEQRPGPRAAGATSGGAAKGKDGKDQYAGVEFGKKGMILKKDADEEDWLFGSKSKKKEKMRAQKKQEEETLGVVKPVVKQNRPLHLTVPRMQAFGVIGLTPPYVTGDIPKTIEAIKIKKAEYEKDIRSEAEVDAEIEQEIAGKELAKQENATVAAKDQTENEEEQ